MKYPDNLMIFDSLGKMKSVLSKHNNIAVSVSGGSDSDLLVDLISKFKHDDININYIWFDTGLEYQATKDHLKYLENRYNISITRIKAKKSIPKSLNEYGQPFLSKYVSEMLSRLQKHNFDFKNADNYTFEEAYKIYPKCKGGLQWFYNDHKNILNENGSIKSHSSFNIGRNKKLREFLIDNPPTFKISNKCCDYAKKKVGYDYIKTNDIDLNITGVRKNEGGIRSVALTSCFSAKADCNDYRPIFWYSDTDKDVYNKYYDVTNSLCYSEYKMKRTGCAGCPFGRNFEEELEILNKYEPKLYKGVLNIFKDSYEYTRRYNEFKK